MTAGIENTGNQSRYFHCYIGGRNVDHLVSDLTGLKQSKGKDTKGVVIIYGCGMDMTFALQEKCRAKVPWLFAEKYGTVSY